MGKSNRDTKLKLNKTPDSCWKSEEVRGLLNMLLQIIHADNDVLLHQKLSDIAASNSHHLTKILGSDSLGNTNWDMATNIWIVSCTIHTWWMWDRSVWVPQEEENVGSWRGYSWFCCFSMTLLIVEVALSLDLFVSSIVCSLRVESLEPFLLSMLSGKDVRCLVSALWMTSDL